MNSSSVVHDSSENGLDLREITVLVPLWKACNKFAQASQNLHEENFHGGVRIPLIYLKWTRAEILKMGLRPDFWG
jgi:hypothetical protein